MDQSNHGGIYDGSKFELCFGCLEGFTAVEPPKDDVSTRSTPDKVCQILLYLTVVSQVE